MKKIKVVEFVTRLEFGGVEAVLLNYIRNFSDKDAFEFHVITQDINVQDCIEQFEKSGFVVHIVTHKRKSILRNVQEIFRILRKEKFDVAHSHMTLTNFYVLFLAWITGVKLRISHSHNAFKSANAMRKAVWFVLKMLNRLAANCWAACGYDAGVFLWGEKAMQGGKVVMMNNAIDVHRFKFNPAVRKTIRARYNLGEAICIGHVGRFMEQKNHSYLIDIFNCVHEKDKTAKLLMIGSGELQECVKEYAYSKGLTDSVIFVGNVTNPHEFYQAMDIFVLPSLFEGLPVVAIEAQTADLPCVFSDRIDKSCAVTDKTKFLSIECEAAIWANEILSMCTYKRNQDSLGKIEAAGYNIVAEAEKLQEKYRNDM